MDAITSAFSNLSSGDGLAGFLKGIAPYAGLGSSIFGTVGNIQANNARNSVLSAEVNRMNAYNRLTPAQVSTGISQLEQPLSSDLLHNVGNAVSGQLAERGLSQAPGIQAEALAQGLAPYQLQEQQMAQQAFFQKLGLPISAQPSPFGPYPQTSNQSQLWQALSRTFMNGPQSNGANNGFNYWAANNATPTVPAAQTFDTSNPPDISGMLSQFLGTGGGAGLDYASGGES
jgi:hypothetical protein